MLIKPLSPPPTDIVFFIFLYQRWIYKVDSKRINEFGFSAEMLEEQQLGKQTPGGALTAAPAATTAETQNNSSAASSDEAKSQPSSPNATKKRKNRKSKANKSAAEKKDD